MGIIGRLFGGKPKPPKLNASVVGHRGIAAGDLAERQRRAERFYETGDPADAPYALEEVEKWQTLEPGTVEAFVHGGQPLFVHSSNVAMIQYHEEANKLMVEFLSGGKYLYSNVSPEEALLFAQAQSKGKWVHSHLKNKKPFQKL